MAIKFYSDRTNKFYATQEEADKAEFELKEQENLAKIEKERKERELKEKKEKVAAERKAAAEEVEQARKDYIAAQKVFREKLEDFCKKYGTYHYSTTSADDIPILFGGLLENLFDL